MTTAKKLTTAPEEYLTADAVRCIVNDMKNAMTLSDLLSDLRYISTAVRRPRVTQLDDYGAALLDIGWVEPIYVIGLGHCLRETDLGLDVIFACRDVALPEAA